MNFLPQKNSDGSRHYFCGCGIISGLENICNNNFCIDEILLLEIVQAQFSNELSIINSAIHIEQGINFFLIDRPEIFCGNFPRIVIELFQLIHTPLCLAAPDRHVHPPP